MSIVENKLIEALKHLDDAEEAMAHLMEGTGDWSASVLLENQFEVLYEACLEFAYLQFGIGLPPQTEEAL